MLADLFRQTFLYGIYQMKDFILASGSPQRKRLLAQIGFEPAKTEPADIDETPMKFEKPSAYVKRMALEKALHVAEKHPGEVVLACDTVVAVGTRIIQKSHNETEQEKVMRALSGKTHRVLSAVCVVNRDGKTSLKLSTTRMVVKRMTEKEIADYVAGHEWDGCSGYKIEGTMEAFVRKIIGSTSGVIGLPLYETKCLLGSAGIK